ncbi:hypothetical protein ACFFSH_31440 [Streptomyces filamentosus]|uniref:GIY-YIG nuclease family protein n=1 Tax=Streptomyces filamentosus TaxID=67294 RepID=A0A919BSH7_STRFL|nr:hypothetical protein [Streptomyces filamentosus]GHG13138.1 hypothetical protein GCM10017667_53580 [Streptomyces filamentosus]
MPPKIDALYAAAVMLDRFLVPQVEYPGSSKPWKCLHLLCGRIVEPTYNSVANEGSGGCKPCSYRWRRLPKKRAPRPYQRGFKGDQQKVRAWVIREKRFLPMEECPGVSHKWRGWCMDCWQETTTRVDSMRRPGAGVCFGCGKKRGGQKRRTPKAVVMAKLREHGVTPDPDHQFTRTTDPWPSICAAAGHPWNARPADVFSGHGCPGCAGMAAITAEDAVAAVILLGVEPVDPYPGRIHARWRVRCTTCDHVWSPTYSNLVHVGSGCPACASHGFAPDRPAYVYVVVHPRHQSVKVGLRGAHTNRLADHFRQDWEFHAELYFEVGADARTVERLTHEHIRAVLRLPIHLTKEQMPQRGYEETVSRAELDEVAAWTLVQRFAAPYATATPPTLVLPQPASSNRGQVLVKPGDQLALDF